jgi:hypothetical protein
MSLQFDQTGTLGSRVGAVTFGNDVQPQFQLNTYSTKMKILNAIDFYYSGGATNTGATLR